MAKTRHMQARMSQRGIRQELVTLTQRFGEPVQDKVVLNRKGIQTLLDELRDIERVAMRALDKGGVVVVESGGSLITTYNLDSYDRGRPRAA
ncbi:hypothetical protein [Azospirillum rugosum]|uniref:DUF4258 domain-containing protein n=1 Tax=Azospirillum rugosum TaxID=416170 RepID=A0ABS4SXA0_9PROT|nr:hypothetical protein [Azospirillum rugosum]MBP2297102.1 hypothetical protein [Azospirillum rugosum]MDQ0530932.1 hypothetical protein [Azospirillum rugosum]